MGVYGTNTMDPIWLRLIAIVPTVEEQRADISVHRTKEWNFSEFT